MKVKEKDVIFNGQELRLTKYFGRSCLFIKNPSQISLPHMQFVGGYPNEYCIYIKDLSDQEKRMITDMNGNIIDLEDEISKLQ